MGSPLFVPNERSYTHDYNHGYTSYSLQYYKLERSNPVTYPPQMTHHGDGSKPSIGQVGTTW